MEKALGPQQPNPNRVRTNLAKLLLDSRLPRETAPQGEHALAAHDTALGPTHAWTIDTARVTADAWVALERTEDAEALRQRFGLK